MTPKDITTLNLPNGTSGPGWKFLVINWLFHQGVSTILLFGMCFGLWKVIPPELENQRKADQLKVAEFKAINESQRLEYRTDLKEHMEKHQKTLEELTAAIRALHADINTDRDST